MKSFARLIHIVLVLSAGAATAAGPASTAPDRHGAAGRSPNRAIFERPGEPRPAGRIDELIFARLAREGVKPARACSDAVFLRRAYIDVIGTLPTPQEARRFLDDRDPAKRAKLIDQLLSREEFATYWAMKWCDILRVKAEFPINLWPNAAQAYHRWVRTLIRDNKPYDQFVRELLTANGSNFRDPPANFYRAVQSREPAGIAQAVALTFLATRVDKWPTGRLDGFAVLFSRIGYKSTSEWKEEIVYFDLAKAAGPADATLPDGTRIQLAGGQDGRVVLADWLTDPKNPAISRAVANRVWCWLLGRGLVHEADDLRLDNPPSHPELLDYLAGQLVESKFDLKSLYRLILNSQTYQLSSLPRDGIADPPPAELFARYPLRQLDAEVLIDALCQITGVPEYYSSQTPEPFTVIPPEERAIALPDGSITSPFLEMFGRPARDTGLESERTPRASAKQRLHLMNSGHVQRKLDQSRNLQGLGRGRNPRQVATAIYLTVLSRYPTEEELKTAEDHARASGGTLANDLAWSLINSSEFLHRH